jgi:hypothetical protein
MVSLLSFPEFGLAEQPNSPMHHDTNEQTVQAILDPYLGENHGMMRAELLTNGR